MTAEPAKARPNHLEVITDPVTGSTSVTIIQHGDGGDLASDYVILTVSRHAPDSLIDAAVNHAKGETK